MSDRIVHGPSRRSVLELAGGLVLTVGLPTGVLAQVVAPNAVKDFAPGAVIRIGRDGVVTLIMSQVEMGQGTHTSMPMIIAEELDIPLSGVVLREAPPSDKLYGNPALVIQATGGSTSVRTFFMPLRKTAAAARAMLVMAAARRWDVDESSCRTADAVVLHPPSGRRAGYGELVDAAALLAPPADPKLKDPRDFKLIGTPAKRLDTPDKVNGKAIYGIDARPPGVKIATLAFSPVFGGKLATHDAAAAMALKGVRQVVAMEDVVAVVADHMWAAMQGLAALKATWHDGPNAKLSQADLWDDIGRASDEPGIDAETLGDPKGAMKGGDVVEAAYDLPILAHAALEPMNCTVHLRPDDCEIWVGTQVMTKALAVAAQESGFAPEKIIIHNHLIGGGFGRRLEVDGVAVAVRIAKHVEGPVKVVWTREEDVRHDMFRGLYRNRMAARLEGGRPIAWTHRAVGPSIIARWLPPAFARGIDPDAVDGATDLAYALPNFHVSYVRHEMQGVPTAFWRGVGPNSNTFAVESFMDLLARKAGIDPVEFRRGLLDGSPRARGVLDLAAAKSDWGAALPARSGRGVSLQSVMGTFVATVATVAVAEDGTVKVARLVTAIDCGIVINPDTVVAQIQGGLIFGLTAALFGEITVEGGRVEQGNFDTYRLLRINEVPRIDVHLVPSQEAPGGVGEPGTISVQGAVINAIYAATDVQLTRMPIKPQALVRVKV